MSEKNHEHASQAIEKGTKKAVQMGKEAAKAAKDIKQAATKAASGNWLGAAWDILKNETTRKALIIAILTPIIAVVLVLVLFLYALPNAIYTYVQMTFGDTIKSAYEEQMFSRASLEEGTVAYLIQYNLDILSQVYNMIMERLGASDGADATIIQEAYDNDEIAEEDLYITQEEESEAKTVNRYAQITANKLNTRYKQIGKAITDNRKAIDDYFESRFKAEYEGDKNSRGKDYYFGKTRIIVRTDGITVHDAAEIISLYAVQSGNNIMNLPIGDYGIWLGLETLLDDALDLENGLGEKRSINLVLGNQIPISIPAWKGNCLPQYLFEQRKYEVFNFGGGQNVSITDYSNNQCSAIDLFIVADSGDDYSTLKPTIASDGKVSWTIEINLSRRSAKDVGKILGLWDDDFIVINGINDGSQENSEENGEDNGNEE